VSGGERKIEGVCGSEGEGEREGGIYRERMRGKGGYIEENISREESGRDRGRGIQ
jgi:hypothetical protein